VLGTLWVLPGDSKDSADVPGLSATDFRLAGRPFFPPPLKFLQWFTNGRLHGHREHSTALLILHILISCTGSWGLLPGQQEELVGTREGITEGCYLFALPLTFSGIEPTFHCTRLHILTTTTHGRVQQQVPALKTRLRYPWKLKQSSNLNDYITYIAIGIIIKDDMAIFVPLLHTLYQIYKLFIVIPQVIYKKHIKYGRLILR